MCTGIALPLHDLPASLCETRAVTDRLYKREGLEEVQFHWWQNPTVLPIQWEGSVHLARWGSKDRRGKLPLGGWVSQKGIDAGAFSGSEPETVVIPASLGYQAGTWFLISQGIRGVLIHTPAGPVVYMLTVPSTNYFRNMTEQSPMMPVLVGQVI